jgi:hypothetical protein
MTNFLFTDIVHSPYWNDQVIWVVLLLDGRKDGHTEAN